MPIHPRSGNSSVEFVLMIAILTAIGLFLMSQLTNQGSNAKNAIVTGATNAVTAVQND
jgi:hypothetical protein